MRPPCCCQLFCLGEHSLKSAAGQRVKTSNDTWEGIHFEQLLIWNSHQVRTSATMHEKVSPGISGQFYAVASQQRQSSV